MRLHFRKETWGGRVGLVPNDTDAAEWMSRLKASQAVALDPVQVRNAERSALYWVVCGIVAQNHAELTSKEAVNDALLILAGRMDVYAIETPGGLFWMRKPHSIAFANMGEDDFTTYMDDAFNIIGTTLLPSCDIDEMRKDAMLASGYRHKSTVNDREI